MQAVLTRLRGLAVKEDETEDPDYNPLNTDPKEEKDPDEEPPTDLEEDPGSLSDKEKAPEEAEAEKIFLAAEKHYENEEFKEARDKFLQLQEAPFGSTKFVRATYEYVLERYHKANIASAPDNEKVVARLQAFFHAKVTKSKAIKKAYRIEYNFNHEVQLKDFKRDREDGSRDRWEMRDEGLYGTSTYALYWKPNLVGDVIVEATFIPKEISNVGFCIMTTGYHRRYVFYPSLDHKWSPWSRGDTAILSTRPERYESVKLAHKSLGFDEFKQNEDMTKKVYVKIQRKGKELLFWVSTKAITKKMKPSLSTENEELEGGQVVLLGAKGTIFTQLAITGNFDPGWMRRFR